VKFKFLAFLLANAISISTHPADAQQPTGKLPRIGYVSGTGDANNSGPNLESFQQSLRDLGYIAGENILVEYRFAAGRSERFPTLVADLVQLRGRRACCYRYASDPGGTAGNQDNSYCDCDYRRSDANKIVESLARPGGNISSGLFRFH
jgi:putative tryptophan/tyrosine transport system substrate-binding protein